MAKVSKRPGVDPTLPRVELKLGDKSYFLCFTFGALALAESKLRAAGVQMNLLHALDLSALDATRVPPLLFAALITHDPDVKYDDVAALVTFRSLPAIFEAISAAYAASLADPEEDAAPLVETLE